MSITATPFPVEEFLRLPEKAGVKQELVGGMVLEMGRAGRRHERVKSRIGRILNRYFAEHPVGEVFSETMFVLDRGESYIPDVAVLLAARIALDEPEKPFEGAPEIAVEVVSSETASDLETKIANYLRAGSHAVWVAYPQLHMLRVHSKDGTVRTHVPPDVLEVPALLPGFQMHIEEIFEGC